MPRASKSFFLPAMADSFHVLPRLVAVAIAGLSFLADGCTTHREISLDSQNPSVRVSRQGILFGDTFVNPQDVPGILEDYDIPKEIGRAHV